MEDNTYPKYVGIPLIVLAGLGIVASFLPFASGSINVLLWGIDIRFRPFTASLTADYWSFTMLFDPTEMIIEPFLDLFYNTIFNSFVPPYVRIIAIGITIAGVATLIIAILGVITKMGIPHSIIALISGGILILLAALEYIIFVNQIFENIVAFEIIFDFTMTALLIFDYNTTVGVGFVLTLIVGIVIVILSIVSLVYSSKTRKEGDAPHKVDKMVYGPSVPGKQTFTRDTSQADKFMISYCPNCGNKIEDKSQRFCNNCGTPLKS